MQTLAELSQQLADGRTSARSLTEQALTNIEAPGGEGRRAFVSVFREAALACADASDRMRSVGVVPSPLAGIPVSVKDVFDIAGLTTLAGSASRANEPRASRDAVIVERLRAAGAVIMGRTNMSEFALGALGLNPHFGDCRNPWDRKSGRVAGGSSSGAAVSVTDGMAVAAVGSDTMGSVRHPAALCGLVGFKPTARRIPLDGVFPLAPSLDSVGPLGRSVACCATMDSILSGEEREDLVPALLEGLRLGIPDTVALEDLDSAVAAAFDKAVSVLSRAGAAVVSFRFPELRDVCDANMQRNLCVIEANAVHGRWVQSHGKDMDPRVTDRFASAGMDIRDYREALEARQETAKRSRRATDRFDAVLMPSIPVIAPLIEDFTRDEKALRANHPIIIRNTAVANYLDRCAITIPCHESGSAPVGLMLLGETMSDRKLLSIAAAVEAQLARSAH
jgi:aspartyl-tRNA(Asn)/glutamyl-tRNA(Gln) amidotransferase subunit A